jgi:hypothetical protein
VEVIGWLYQFYIAEKKDEVDAKVKRGGKVEPDELPAKTALYTPHWIVRYLVENSLGRLWLLNRPNSGLAGHMPYYIVPEEPETDFLRIASPEEIRLGDPACGSGHMLTYAFDLLYLIYEEEGYNPPDIPRLILEQNLYGMEIDPRSASLAAFALTMKARGRDRRFLKRGVTPHICAYTPAEITEAELAGTSWFKALRTNLVDLPIRDALLHDLGLWGQIANIGSLLQPQLTIEQIETLQGRIGAAGNLLDGLANERVLGVLEQLAHLARRYHVVVTNPPYLGSRDFNDELTSFGQAHYPDGKLDLFAMSIERGVEQTLQSGYTAMVTMQSWMFLTSYEQLRKRLLAALTIECMVHMDNMVMEIAFGTAATVWKKHHRHDFRGYFSYVRCEDLTGENLPRQFPVQNERLARASAKDFEQIPGSPIAYWVSDSIRNTFSGDSFGDCVLTEGQNKTADNDRYLRFVWEVSARSVGRDRNWLLYAKGGRYRRWYGNLEYVVNWSVDAREYYRRSSSCRIINERFWYREGISWTDITTARTAFRFLPPDTTFDMKGPTAFLREDVPLLSVLGLLNSAFVTYLLPVLNPTMSTQLRDIRSIPLPKTTDWMEAATPSASSCVLLSKADWDARETSSDFATLPWVVPGSRSCSLLSTYDALLARWRSAALEMQRLEEENNRIFIHAYGLQNELTPDVPLSEITLTCNPHYRYGGNKSEEELERLLRAETMREFISYAVGCMFGRYSLDKPGLVLANAGETLDDYLRIVGAEVQARSSSSIFDLQSSIRFLPDKDNVLPILDGDWFIDDIVARFGRFLRVTFGEEHYAENLAFIEASLGRDLRSFFVREFYDDHLKRYQRRPIYWLFSSPGGSFNALVYMHRYRPDTVSVVLNDYLREYIAKLAASRADALHNSIRAGASNREKAAALKEAGRLDKVLKELAEYETVLLELARKQIAIDLDDGVKVNYAKFGPALRRVVGLNA